MSKYQVEIKNIKEIAENTLFVEFSKPKDFVFKAGQFLMMSLPQLPSSVEKGNRRPFSIASAPFEDNLVIVCRKSESPFKQKLASLKPGDSIEIEGPYGVFTLPEKDKGQTLAFLAGGVGITPIRSMILQALKENLNFNLVLFYSNRRPEDTAFLEELSSIEDPRYKFVGTMTNMEESKISWEGEKGFIDKEMLQRHLRDPLNAIYYIVGPPGFVVAMKNMLKEAKVPSQNIKVEEFAGY